MKAIKIILEILSGLFNILEYTIVALLVYIFYPIYVLFKLVKSICLDIKHSISGQDTKEDPDEE